MGSSARRSAFETMNAPARKRWPAASKSSSAACILTVAFLKRNVTRLLSVVCSTMSTGPLPSMRPGAFASVVSSAIG